MLFSDRPLSAGIDVLVNPCDEDVEVCGALTERARASRRYPSSSTFSWSSSRLGPGFSEAAGCSELAVWPVRRCIGHNQLQRQIHLAPSVKA